MSLLMITASYLVIGIIFALGDLIETCDLQNGRNPYTTAIIPVDHSNRISKISMAIDFTKNTFLWLVDMLKFLFFDKTAT